MPLLVALLQAFELLASPSAILALTTLTIAVLVWAAVRVGNAPESTATAVTRAALRDLHVAFVAQCDPDSAGRPRPRAPSQGPVQRSIQPWEGALCSMSPCPMRTTLSPR